MGWSLVPGGTNLSLGKELHMLQRVEPGRSQALWWSPDTGHEIFTLLEFTFPLISLCLCPGSSSQNKEAFNLGLIFFAHRRKRLNFLKKS